MMRKKGKVIICLVVLASCLLFAGKLLAARRAGKKAALSSDNATIPFTLRWQGEDYAGVYQGAVKNGMPGGTGTFTGEDGGLSCTGTWEKGEPDGDMEIVGPDGVRETGIYAKGKRSGLIRIETGEDEYTECLYEEDQAYGNMVSYKNGKQTAAELIVNGSKADEIRDDALLLTGDVLSSCLYTDRYIYVEGEIAFISMDESSCHFRLNSDSIGMTAGTYQNGIGNGSLQQVIPNFKVGDTVRLYGIYSGFLKVSDQEDHEYYGYNCVTIDPLLGEIIPVVESDSDYQNMDSNPYAYYGIRTEGQFVVEKCKSEGDTYYVHVHDLQDNTGTESFVLIMEGEAGTVFYPGELLAVNGYYAGQYRERFVKSDNIELDEELVSYTEQLTWDQPCPCIFVAQYDVV